MSQDTLEPQYEVGYGKPPAASRFRPGQSGTPHGRQKGSKNGKALLQAELAAKVVLTENNKRVKTTKLGLIVKQMVNKAAKGDVKDFIALSKHYGSDETASKTGNDEAAFEGEEDAKTYESFLKRLKGDG